MGRLIWAFAVYICPKTFFRKAWLIGGTPVYQYFCTKNVLWYSSELLLRNKFLRISKNIHLRRIRKNKKIPIHFNKKKYFLSWAMMVQFRMLLSTITVPWTQYMNSGIYERYPPVEFSNQTVLNIAIINIEVAQILILLAIYNPYIKLPKN